MKDVLQLQIVLLPLSKLSSCKQGNVVYSLSAHFEALEYPTAVRHLSYRRHSSRLSAERTNQCQNAEL